MESVGHLCQAGVRLYSDQLLQLFAVCTETYIFIYRMYLPIALPKTLQIYKSNNHVNKTKLSMIFKILFFNKMLLNIKRLSTFKNLYLLFEENVESIYIDQCIRHLNMECYESAIPATSYLMRPLSFQMSHDTENKYLISVK